jgi:hypothetical protein
MCLAPKARNSPPAWGSAAGIHGIPKSVSAESAIHFSRDFVPIIWQGIDFDEQYMGD